MIAVDTNILARYYVDDPGDVEAVNQRPRAERVMRDSSHVFVPVATRLLRAGLDFADALHLASSDTCEAFLSFDDRRFAKRAQKLGCVPLVQTPD